MPIRLTPLMRQRLTRRALGMITRSLRYFPELKDTAITVGYTRKHLGSATVIFRKYLQNKEKMPTQTTQKRPVPGLSCNAPQPAAAPLCHIGSAC